MTDPFNQTGFNHIKYLCCFLVWLYRCKHPTCCSWGAKKKNQQSFSICTAFMFELEGSFLPCPSAMCRSSVTVLNLQEWLCHHHASVQPGSVNNKQLHLLHQECHISINHHPVPSNCAPQRRKKTPGCRFQRRVCWLWYQLFKALSEHHSGFVLPLHFSLECVPSFLALWLCFPE